MQIGIVGPGRLGRSLARLLRETGAEVDLVGRERPPRGAVVLLTVPDDRIEEAARALPPGPIVLHCSGTAPVDALAPHHPRGSFHPLMSFPGPHQTPDLTGVPAALAGDPEALRAGEALARRLGMTPLRVPGDRRLYHAAAVFAGNFATVLLAEASALLAAAGIDPAEAPQLLAPLALRSIRNAAEVSPRAALTGPVARGDHNTVEQHRQAMADAGLQDQLHLYDALCAATLRLRDGASDHG